MICKELNQLKNKEKMNRNFKKKISEWSRSTLVIRKIILQAQQHTADPLKLKKTDNIKC